MKTQTPLLSIIIPVYNEEKTLHSLLLKVQAVFSNNVIHVEIIIVDDHSTDNTPHIISSLLATRVPITIKTT